MTTVVIAIFVLGYLAIVFEHALHLNKSATALLTGVLCWTVYAVGGDARVVGDRLPSHVAELSGILFFLLGAMTIVELIDAHDGFLLITSRITTRSRRKLLLTTTLLAFLLSAVLDNLTTAILMMSLIRRLVRDETHRMYYAGIVIIAANAGGVWSPIGDVTTTMLWIGGQISSTHVIRQLFIPSLVSVLVPVIWIAWSMKGTISRPLTGAEGGSTPTTTARDRKIVLVTGLAGLLFVPIFKALTHLPPFMGILFGLGILWAVTERIHKRKTEEHRGPLTVAGALRRVDSPSILFFLGILLAISALEDLGVLRGLAETMDRVIGNVDAITIAVGLSSAVIDNVPLVGATKGMYSLATFPTDHHFWIFLTYCAGTGGSILIIGSAAGVAVMGLQRISFGWYLRTFSVPALLGYLVGALCHLVLTAAGM